MKAIHINNFLNDVELFKLKQKLRQIVAKFSVRWGGQEKPSEFVEVAGPTFDVAAHASLKHGCDVAVVVCVPQHSVFHCNAYELKDVSLSTAPVLPPAKISVQHATIHQRRGQIKATKVYKLLTLVDPT